ncbi:MAG TPA: PF20097 family protein [Pyrinomonadaceae bacterium]|nr:PF20097 family protein [Pyrinomonadaceae bacterium]
MADRNLTCSECDGEMEEGFILDSTHGALMVSRWLSGKPEPSWWQGTKTKGKKARIIETYRCVKCGLLKSYASTITETPGMFTP